MSIFKYPASDLYSWLTAREDFLLLDVRNAKDFDRFQIESPFPFKMLNVAYFDFMEIEEESVARVPRDRPIRIVCAKEDSAKYVAEILEKHGFKDLGYLEGGIKSWGNLLVPMLLSPKENYQLFQFIRPGKASCSYGLKYSGELMVFDPSRNIDFYLDFAKKNGCKLIKTFETHLQADYISGSRVLAERTGAEFRANENDFGSSKNSFIPVEDGEIYSFSGGGPEVKVFFTPGHTPGSTSFIIDNKFFISGDSTFIHSIGRPDLGGQVDAWSDILFETLKKITQLSDDILVLPGHYINWEEANSDLCFVAPLAEVKKHNRDIFAIDNKGDFLTFIKGNMRDQPPEYAEIRLINGNLKQVDDDKAEELDLGKNECAASAYAAQQTSQ
ncbi:MAG: MBL fold metallo-hydrolase [Deltaproteobacteria bacterium]|nr:MBL fold metallo-hydrolase [Deltaproteobacteria bacterium]